MSVLEKIISNLFGTVAKGYRSTHYDGRIEHVIKITSDVTGVPVADLVSKRRLNSDERHVAMYLAVRLLGCSYPEVGRAFGRDHTTVMYACKKIDNRGRGRTKLTRTLKKLSNA